MQINADWTYTIELWSRDYDKKKEKKSQIIFHLHENSFSSLRMHALVVVLCGPKQPPTLIQNDNTVTALTIINTLVLH